MTSHLLAGGDVLSDLGINLKVLGIQAFIFIVTFAALKVILFDRLIAFMKAREADAASQADKIRHDRADVEKLLKEYEAHIARIDKDAYARLQALLKEAVEARAKIVGDAQLQASGEAKAALASIQDEKKAARVQLRTEVVELTRQAATRVIDVPVEASALDAAVRRAVPEAMS